jgi:hypothetical protein
VILDTRKIGSVGQKTVSGTGFWRPVLGMLEEVGQVTVVALVDERVRVYIDKVAGGDGTVRLVNSHIPGHSSVLY